MQIDGFDILFEEGPCLVINKPSGVATQAPPGIDSLEWRIKAFLKKRHPEYDNIYLGVPHRLDRPASGAMVFCTKYRAARKLSEQFERRTVKKTYWALVEGNIDADSGTWQDHLRKVYGKPQAEVVAADHPEARQAILHFTVLARAEWGTWLEIQLETGRTHQVRIQAASRGHPLLGDSFYGAASTFGPFFEDERLRPIALHARRLEFFHPSIKTTVSVEAPTDANWKNYIS